MHSQLGYCCSRAYLGTGLGLRGLGDGERGMAEHVPLTTDHPEAKQVAVGRPLQCKRQSATANRHLNIGMTHSSLNDGSRTNFGCMRCTRAGAPALLKEAHWHSTNRESYMQHTYGKPVVPYEHATQPRLCCCACFKQCLQAQSQCLQAQLCLMISPLVDCATLT